MTQIKLNKEKIIDFLVEQALEDITVKQMISKRQISQFLMEQELKELAEEHLLSEASVETGIPAADAMLKGRWYAGAEKELDKVIKQAGNAQGINAVPPLALKAWSQGKIGKESGIWEDAAKHWNVSERELTHLVLAIGSVVPVLGVPAALYDSLLYYEDYEKTKDPWKLLWAAVAALSAIPALGAGFRAAGMFSKAKLAAALAKPGVSVKAAAIFSKLGPRGAKMAQGLEAFKAGQLGEAAARIPGISAAGKAKAIAGAKAAAKAGKGGSGAAGWAHLAGGAEASAAAAKAGKGVVAAMEAGKVAQARKFAFVVADIEKWIGVATRTSPKLAAAVKAGKVKDIIKFEARLARNLARTGHSQSQINAALKAAGSTAKIKQVGTSVVALEAAATKALNVKMYNNMIKELGKAPGLSQQALKTLFKVEYSGVQAIGKLGKYGKAIPAMRIAYPIYAVAFSDGHKEKIYAKPPIAPDVDPVPKPRPRPRPSPGGRGRGQVMMLQRKLNDFASVLKIPGLKPNRRAPKEGAGYDGTGVDGYFGPDTYGLAKKILGSVPELSSLAIAKKNVAKIDKMLSDKYEKEQTASKVGAEAAPEQTGTRVPGSNITATSTEVKESKDIFSSLREHKQKVNNETFDKLVKGLF